MNKNALKKVYDFYVWLDGFCAALNAPPNEEQWEVIQGNRRLVFDTIHGRNSFDDDKDD